MKCKFEHDEDCCNCGSPQYMCKCKPSICGCVVPMTNADRIRAMSDEDLAWELMLWRCEAAAKYHGIESQYPDTQSTILDWLKQTAEEDDHA